jgi:hypothetical protein
MTPPPRFTANDCRGREVLERRVRSRLPAPSGESRANLPYTASSRAPVKNGGAHGFLNRYEEPARLLFVYPTHQVEQVEVSILGATLAEIL